MVDHLEIQSDLTGVKIARSQRVRSARKPSEVLEDKDFSFKKGEKVKDSVTGSSGEIIARRKVIVPKEG